MSIYILLAVLAFVAIVVTLIVLSAVLPTFASVLEWLDDHQEARLRTQRYVARLQCGHILPPHLQEPEEEREDDAEFMDLQAWFDDSGGDLTQPEQDHIVGMWKVAVGRRKANANTVKAYRTRLLDLGVPLN